jgi:hypothetical protein
MDISGCRLRADTREQVETVDESKMAIENLPRPWLLAALTGMKITDLLALEPAHGAERRPQGGAPRPEPRRRRLRPVTAEDRFARGEEARCN